MASNPKRLTLNHQLNLPDEVLIEILLRLPLLSLQLFKSVSKHWLSLITSEYFNRRLLVPRIDTPCGLFIHQYIKYKEYYDFVTLGPKVTSFPLRATIGEAGYNFRIMQSQWCNGLVLCSNVVWPRTDYYVYNPFTQKFKKIPFPWKPVEITNMMLAFDPTKSPYYKVMLTETRNRRKDRQQHREEDREEDSEEDLEEDSEKYDCNYAEQIQIYSSETGKWRLCGPPFHKGTFSDLQDGIYWNNAIHWIHYKDELHYKLDIVDHIPIVTNIETPTLEKYVNYEYTKLFESRGRMLLLMREYWVSRYRYHVFEMMEESSEWSVKYIVDDLDDIVPLKWIPSRYQYNPFLCIVLGERRDDSFMVIESDNKIVRYNFVSKTVSTVFSFLSSDSTYRYIMPVPFIASLAGV